MSETIVAYRSFIGVDLHKTTVTLVAVGPDGTEIARLKINTKCRQKIRAWLLDLPRPSHMAVEAVGFVWRQLSSVLARTKQFMRSILLAANLRGPKLDGSSGQRWLLAHGHKLKPVQRRGFANLIQVVQLIELQREPLRFAIIEASRSERFAPMTKILQSARGQTRPGNLTM